MFYSTKSESLHSKNTQCNKQISSFSLSYVDGNKTIGLCDIKFLSKGAYGEVYEFSNRNYKVAIKTYKYSDDDEIKTIQDLNRKNIKCDIINAKVFKNGSKYITVMDLMNGPLSNMKGKLKTNEIFVSPLPSTGWRLAAMRRRRKNRSPDP